MRIAGRDGSLVRECAWCRRDHAGHRRGGGGAQHPELGVSERELIVVEGASSEGQKRLKLVGLELVQCELHFQIIMRVADGGERVRANRFESTEYNA
ncbi:uncharacterized protein MONOS_17356 [Monocercomonoides exilis]|uniref:uncharacterized protein n=1 Tax=Monocercomonoides exilis TaxID=2049356 RepID=UPI00355A3187|nr:hypothetical protein MONOS_17356 [Monocercomonoides exilis]